jgi:DNA-binding MarR family transcriptional regulator
MTPNTRDRLLIVMRRWRSEGAHWTSDLADAIAIPTAKANRELRRMEAAGIVRRVVIGNPTSWELADGN